MSEGHVTVKIPKELVDEMDKLKGKHGFRSRGEITKEAVRQFLKTYQNEIALAPLPRFEQINSSSSGVLLLDRELRKPVEIYIKPSGIKCSFDQRGDCVHVHYIMTIPAIAELIKKRRKEGWKLPDKEVS